MLLLTFRCSLSLQMLMANAVDTEARTTPGKKQLAMEAFARALRQLPTIIADNAGYDSAELVSKIRAAHAAGEIRSGIDVRSGTVGNMQELGITEAAKLKRQVLLSAAEAAEMILRVDDIIKCAPRKREDDREFNLRCSNVVSFYCAFFLPPLFCACVCASLQMDMTTERRPRQARSWRVGILLPLATTCNTSYSNIRHVKRQCHRLLRRGLSCTIAGGKDGSY